jgi:RNA polymerase sigma factor (sigma-70 family)
MIAAHLTRLVHTLRQNCHDPADDELLARFSEHGDSAAFETVVRRHGPAVLAACRQVLSEPADVDDVFQATFLTLLQRPRAVRRGASVGCWLYGVAHRIALRARDTAVRRRGLLRHAARPGVVEPADLSWPEACAILHEELDRLPDRLRLPLLLCYLEGQSRDEAARNLGWTVGAVKGCLERGRRILADRLTRRGITLSAGLLTAVTAPACASAGPSSRLVEATLLAGVRPSPAVAARAAPATLAPRTVLAAGLLLAGVLAVFVLHAPPAEGDPPRPAPPAPAPPADPMGQTFTYAGRVLGPDGKPLPGAKVHICGLNPGVIQYAERATTGKGGTFRFTVRRDEFGDKGRVPAHRSPPERFVHLAASAEGCGSATGWAARSEDREKVTIWLPAEEVVKARFLDLEGKPVAGVEVSAYLRGSQWAKDGKPIAFDAPDEEGGASGNVAPFDDKRNHAVSDREGRVTLRGLGRGWLYDLYISGPTIITAKARVAARPQKPTTTWGEGFHTPERGDPRLPLYGSEFTHVVAPCKPIVGVVRDGTTGKPVADATVQRVSTREDDPNAHAKTDAEGRYKLLGLPRGVYTFTVNPPANAPYLAKEVRVDAGKPGIEPVTLDVELERQPAAKGRVTIAGSGKPAQGWVEYRPLASNPNLKKNSLLAQPRWRQHPPSTKLDRDGRFTLAVLPGPGVLLFQGDGDFEPARLARADRLAGVALKEDPELLDTRPRPSWPAKSHAYQLIDVAAGKDVEVSPELTPARQVPIAFEFPDGKARDVAALGLRQAGASSGEMLYVGSPAAVRSVSAGETRRLFFSTTDSAFAATATVDGSKPPEMLTVKLLRTGRVRGRVLGADGKPLKEASFQVLYDDGPGRPGVHLRGGSTFRLSTPDEDRRSERLTGFIEGKFRSMSSSERSDERGWFELSGIAAGLEFDLKVVIVSEPNAKGERFVRGLAKLTRSSVKPGETHNLGDLMVGEVEKD